MLLSLLACSAPPPAAPPAVEPAPAVAAPAPPTPPVPERPVPTHGTRVVLLGTGTPVPDPDRSGPATAVVDDARAWLVDAGPGVVRRATKAARDQGLPQLAAARLDTVLLTHLHSDHTLGLPDVLLGAWVLGRETPLHLVGPPGTRELAEGLLAAWKEDIALRSEVEALPAKGLELDVVETTGGVVADGGGMRITAFEVPHGTWKHALGYRFDGADGRSVVISGDTGPSDAVVTACDGCDLLIHEVYAKAGWDASTDPDFQRYHASFHTSAVQLGELATRARPKQLLLTHQLYFGKDDATLLSELRAGGFQGPAASGRDLEIW